MNQVAPKQDPINSNEGIHDRPHDHDSVDFRPTTVAPGSAHLVRLRVEPKMKKGKPDKRVPITALAAGKPLARTELVMRVVAATADLGVE